MCPTSIYAIILLLSSEIMRFVIVIIDILFSILALVVLFESQFDFILLLLALIFLITAFTLLFNALQKYVKFFMILNILFFILSIIITIPIFYGYHGQGISKITAFNMILTFAFLVVPALNVLALNKMTTKNN